MAAMADWTDGPEYAPAQRPDVFAAPDAPALEGAPDVTPAPIAAPAEPPASFALDPGVVDLASLAPASGVTRDPYVAFEASALPRAASDVARDPRQPLRSTGGHPGSAWGAAHTAFPPPTTAPLVAAGMPLPASVVGQFPLGAQDLASGAYPAPGWGTHLTAPAPTTYPPDTPLSAPAPRPVRFVEVLQSVGVSMELLMLFATWSTYLGPLLLMFAVQASRRVSVQRATVTRITLGVTVASAVLAALGSFLTYGFQGDDLVQMLVWWWESWQALMMPTALLLLVSVNAVVALGLRNGEGRRA